MQVSLPLKLAETLKGALMEGVGLTIMMGHALTQQIKIDHGG